MRVIQGAVTIILEDIISQVYETKQYPPQDTFLQNVNTIILLDGIILKY